MCCRMGQDGWAVQEHHKHIHTGKTHMDDSAQVAQIVALSLFASQAYIQPAMMEQSFYDGHEMMGDDRNKPRHFFQKSHFSTMALCPFFSSSTHIVFILILHNPHLHNTSHIAVRITSSLLGR